VPQAAPGGRGHRAARGRRAAADEVGSVFCSLGKLEWAVESCSLPLSGELLLHAARAGQLELFSWLRRCPWTPCY
jgi:hypothetical protein